MVPATAGHGAREEPRRLDRQQSFPPENYVAGSLRLHDRRLDGPSGGAEPAPRDRQPEFCADFYLAQIVSHYDTVGLDKFLDECAARGVQIPGVFGVFYYRSANRKTLGMLRQFFPVADDGLTRDFAAGKGSEQVCAESVRALLGRGVKNIYISNLPMIDVEGRLSRIEGRPEGAPAAS